MTRNRLGILLLVLQNLITVSCGDHPDAYAVVLWAEEDGGPEAGSILPIAETSRGGDRHLYTSDGSNREIDAWRVRLFDEVDAAEAFGAEYGEYAHVFARANVNALPVRERQDRSSVIVYRLRDGERLKVLDRSDEPVNEGGLVAHWYRVLTEEGVEGHVFGYHLSVYDVREGIVEEEPELDPVLQGFLSKVWRPIYFAEMLERGTYDLEIFTPNIGFFPDPRNNTLRLVLPTYSQKFEYKEIIEVAPRRYMAVGTSLQFIVRSDSVAALQYTRDGEPASLALQTIEEDIDAMIAEERARRAMLYEEFFDLGILRSSAYGRIEFFEDRMFEWQEYDRLVPNAIPRVAGNSGSVAFDTYPGPDFQSRFDGVISFYFDGAPDTAVRFLYARSADGVRMQFVPEPDVRENVVVRQSLSPVVIFFSRQG